MATSEQSAPTAPRRILVAVRAEGDDGAVVRYAAELARSLGAELILVAIAPVVPVLTTSQYPFDPFSPAAEVDRQELADRLAREGLDELVATLEAALPKESVLTWGPVGLATVEAAREHAADLVVVGMRARDHELGHMLHDHADRYVLHHCHVPVLVVPTTS
ncbi:MAG: Universal stress protein family [Solirubrobacteraceae bacterium]|jgi:nucleotide-binding universal stress UspA family protein|nr:Universal stress protein family [Solirubrobacteraceae bacterium]